MAVDTTDLAPLDFRAEARKADLLTSQAHHTGRLLADMVELEDAHVELAAVHAPGCPQDIGGEEQIALAALGSPAAVDPPPSLSLRRAPSVAVRTHDLAPRHLRQESHLEDAAPHERRDLCSSWADVIELEDHWIGLRAVDTRMRAQERKDEVLRLADALRLERVVAAAVMSAPL